MTPEIGPLFDMQKLLPLWLFLLCLLLGALFTVFFAWSVKSTVSGSPRFGRLGKAAVVVASFPDTVRSSLREMRADPDSGFRVSRTSRDLSQFHPIKMKPGIHIQGPVVLADQAALARASGWRVLVGGFVIDGEFTHAALALSPELEIVKVWKLPEQDIQGQEPRPPFRKYVHGFALLKDGSVIFSFDGGVSLQRFNPCGRRIWSTGGFFNHVVTLDEEEKFAWTLRVEAVDKKLVHDTVVKVATATGEIVRRITMDDIIAANPTLHVLDIREDDRNYVTGNPRNTSEEWLDEPFHLNDVEPLPAAIADRFEGFEPGDLLLSARSLNLVFVVDPDTLGVKWWRIGAWRRQHDPDWQPTGEITVYDNRMSLDYSRIVGVVPASQSTRVVFDGRSVDFYSRIRGKHQITKAGNLLITSPQQGRVFEVEPNGQVVLEVFNLKPGSDEFNYPMSEAIWFPSDAFDFAEDFSCAK
jgi:Arylsulfotransferase (ASST)